MAHPKGTSSPRVKPKQDQWSLPDTYKNTSQKMPKSVEDKKKGGNVRDLYAAGGILETSAIIMGGMSAASGIRLRGKYEEAGFIENSKRLKMAAEDAKKRGAKDVADFIKGIRKFEGAQVAAMAAQGIEVTSGSAADIREETLETGFEDAATIRTNAIREAFGYKKQALELESQARQTRIARKFNERNAKTLAYTQAASTVASTGIQMNKAGTAKTPAKGS